jgi:hypothetical protein
MILTGAVVLEAAILAGILYGMLASPGAMLPLALSGAILAYFIRLFCGAQNGSAGTITADRVVLRPNTLLGIRLPGPRGDYAIDRFSDVRVELMPGPAGLHDVMQGGPHARIWLVGREAAPAVLIARTERETGRALGRGFGAALGLPVRETHEPY